MLATVTGAGSRSMKFGKKLGDLRRAAQLTQEQFAERLRLTAGAVRDYEQGRRLPSWPVLVRMCRILNVTANEFSECDEVADGADETSEPPKSRTKTKKK
jgi:transcriptional regulator with XRE-family HTH domain